MPTTRRLILNYLEENQTATSPELSRVLHLTPANIRYHLSNLREEGLIQPVDDLNLHRKGRPPVIYQLAAPQQADPYVSMVKSLLNSIPRDLSTDQIMNIAGNLAVHTRGEKQHHMIHRLNNAIDSLNGYGHQANWIASRDGPTIELHGCPFQQIIDDHPELCEIDREVIHHCTGMVFEQTDKLKTDQKKRVMCKFRLKERG